MPWGKWNAFEWIFVNADEKSINFENATNCEWFAVVVVVHTKTVIKTMIQCN